MRARSFTHHLLFGAAGSCLVAAAGAAALAGAAAGPGCGVNAGAGDGSGGGGLAARAPEAPGRTETAAALPPEPLPRPAPGADIADLPAGVGAGAAAPSASAAAGDGATPRAVVPLDLGADRPVAAIALPSPAAGTSASFTFDEGRRGWVATIPSGGYGIPTPAYGDGRIYVSGGFETYSFYALDAESGRTRWTHPSLEDNGPTAPVYVGGNVVFNTESCTLFVLDAKTGRTKWSKYLGDPTLSQPAVADGLIFTSYPASGQRFAAFRVKDGVEVWSRPVSAEVLSAPAIAGDSVYVTTVAGTTYRFRRSDGKLVWSRAHSASSAPWFFDGEVFLSRTAKGSELEVALDAGTGKADRVLRSTAAPYARDVPRTLDDWRKVWAFEGSRPVIAGGRRFDTMGGEIHASDPKTGAPLWIRRYTDGAGKRAMTAPAVAGAKLFFATYGGDLYALDTDTGMTVWAYRLGVPMAFQPIVAKGWVYLTTTNGKVIGLSLADPTLDGWHMWGGNPAHNGVVL
ncbi:MAG TPA: PQQ-binding-like beta-propeller repeat protein [Myxococcota bacterium]|jgi:Ca-activated chloride channel family protein|nr:PQQ-binding-like beta-propeller repeat protein [Myxococcota bacterium]